MENWQWKLAGSIATLQADDAIDPPTIDLAQPSTGILGWVDPATSVLGLSPLTGPDGAAAGELLLADAYLRGRDLIAHYEPTEAFPFRTELYWRRPPADAPAEGLTLIVSVETDLLDTRPTLLVHSSPPGDAIKTYDDQGALASPGAAVAAVATGAHRAWCETLHPSDRSEATLELDAPANGRVGIRWRLFSRFLEKGVIRRARLAATLLPADESAARQRFTESFAAQAPPLTA